MRKSTICFAIFYCCTQYAPAQELVNPGRKSVLLTRVPFIQYNGGVMVLKATVGSLTDTLRFILDTGCAGISLDSATCAFYHITTVHTDTVINGMGGSHKVSYV